MKRLRFKDSLESWLSCIMKQHFISFARSHGAPRGLVELGRPIADLVVVRDQVNYILKTPNRVAGIGALRAALSANATTRRVSPGVMMPSSHSRAVA